MAGASAITQLADRVPDIRVLVFLMRVGSEVVSVAAGAIGLVSGVRPVHGLRIVLVTVRAREIAAMIEGLVRKTHVPVVVGDPGSRVMALVTLPLRDEVPRILAGRNIPVVTGRTGAEYLGVIDAHDGAPRRCAVTVLADIRCQYMRRVFAGRVYAVVTVMAVAGDIHMIEVGGKPCNRRVAVVAIVAAGNMRRMFSSRDRAVVA